MGIVQEGNIMRKLAKLAGIGASAMALGLAGCGDEPAAVEEDAGGCIDGVEVTGGWLALPAIPGDPAAAYFEITNNTDTELLLMRAEMDGAASTQFHRMGEWNFQPSMDELLNVEVPAGETVVFAPEDMHVMVMEPATTWEAGGEGEMTLGFPRGLTCTFPVTFRAAGDMPEAADSGDDGEAEAE